MAAIALGRRSDLVVPLLSVLSAVCRDAGPVRVRLHRSSVHGPERNLLDHLPNPLLLW
jgi:hypothetical protein